MENRFLLFPPKVLYVSNITQDALLSVQNKSLLFYTHYFSNEWCDFFALSVAHKKVTAEIPHHQQKVPLKKCCYKMTWSNSPIKHQIIKSFTNTIPNTSRQLNSRGSWGGDEHLPPFWCVNVLNTRKCKNSTTNQHSVSPVDAAVSHWRLTVCFKIAYVIWGRHGKRTPLDSKYLNNT